MARTTGMASARAQRRPPGEQARPHTQARTERRRHVAEKVSEIGRGAGRERGEISVGGGSLKKKKKHSYGRDTTSSTAAARQAARKPLRSHTPSRRSTEERAIGQGCLGCTMHFMASVAYDRLAA